ncbi:hypothetical protein [Endothiovibrio diazotrophicus]
MDFPVDEATRKAAKSPHELFMINLAVFHLLVGPGAIILIGGGALELPVLLSSLVIAFTWWRGRTLEKGGAPWFVVTHWKYALRRYRILLIGYVLTALILGAGELVGMGAANQVTRDMLFTIFSRFGVMPTVLAVFVCLVLESSALYQATGGQLPDALVDRYPPPASDAD